MSFYLSSIFLGLAGRATAWFPSAGGTDGNIADYQVEWPSYHGWEGFRKHLLINPSPWASTTTYTFTVYLAYLLYGGKAQAAAVNGPSQAPGTTYHKWSSSTQKDVHVCVCVCVCVCVHVHMSGCVLLQLEARATLWSFLTTR